MKNFFSKLIFTFTIALVPAIMVSAAENDEIYKNELGVEMTIEDYNYLKDNLGESFAKYADEILINSALENVDNIKVMSLIKPRETIVGDLTYDISIFENTPKGYYNFLVWADWSKAPTVKSFDVLAWRWNTSDFNITKYTGTQTTDAGIVNYSQTGGNTKQTAYGIGTSMNIINRAQKQTTLQLNLGGCFKSKKQVSFYGTYQHATSDVNLAQSQNYTFGSSGLGGVLNYPTNIRNYYSNYAGFSRTFTPSATC